MVHNQFIDLGNSVETIVHYLLIEWMTCLVHWDEVFQGECISLYGYT